MKDKNKIDNCFNAHLKNARQTDVLSTGLPRLFQRLAMTVGRLAKYPESRHSGAREAVHTLGRRHCERSAAIQSHERTRQRSHLPSPAHGNSIFSPAFTIVELLVVIVVIAILAAITIVSYRSVSSNARKSAMASDLEQANKSLQVNKETSSSETFPSTLSGAGITLSNNATYSYNVSADGSNYCLQGTVDGVTKSIAGNNQTVSNSTCVSATNLITNGDFSQGTSGWTSRGGSLSVVNGVGVVSNAIFWEDQNISLVSGHEYYLASRVWLASGAISSSANSSMTTRIMNTTVTTKIALTSISVDSSGAIITGSFNSWIHSSGLYTADGTEDRVVFRYGGYSFANSINGRYDNLILIDLTATLNAGNEPTATEMDAILANFPNSWFNGQNVIQVPTS